MPSPVEIPESVGEPAEPPHVLFVGRLSPEKGIHEFLAATEGLPRVIVGAGPVDVPEAVGFVPRSELGPYYERAAVVCVPSRREGYGVVAREAMAYGRPVVATAVGGLVDITRRPRPAGRRRAAARGARGAARGRATGARSSARRGGSTQRKSCRGEARAPHFAPPTTPRSSG